MLRKHERALYTEETYKKSVRKEVCEQVCMYFVGAGVVSAVAGNWTMGGSEAGVHSFVQNHPTHYSLLHYIVTSI